MKLFLMNLSANLVSLACLVISVLCILNPWGAEVPPSAWGWFLFVSVITYRTYTKSKPKKVEKEKPKNKEDDWLDI